MTDLNATALVIDAAQLVARGDPRAAVHLMESTEVVPRDVERQALLLLVYILSGDHAAEHFADLRRGILERAIDTRADDRDVTAALEAIGAAQLLAAGDLEGTNTFLQGADTPPMLLAFNAAALTGQAIAQWISESQLSAFFNDLRRERLGGAA